MIISCVWVCVCVGVWGGGGGPGTVLDKGCGTILYFGVVAIVLLFDRLTKSAIMKTKLF